MAYKKTITITIDLEVHQRLIDLGYSGVISQICEEALRQVVIGTNKKAIDRLSSVPPEWLEKAKKRMKEDPVKYSEVWAKIINEKCGTDIKGDDLLMRFFPVMARNKHK